MKIYLVGGAVRDELLERPITERDWVVVGATPDALLKQGYRCVGRDFPVYLHPITGEEYALARTERKQGPGYHGFQFDINPNVTLEQDLSRRDLTINAMAKDDAGNLIDPYHGLRDLHNKCLRHVSPAFVEDPVRVLRVARFAARYHALGFRIAPETQTLMSTLVQEGELAHLVSERVWSEWSKSLAEPNPECFLWVLRDCGAQPVVLPELSSIFEAPQALRALQYAVQHSSNPMVRFAALTHDLPTRDALCQRLRVPNAYLNLAQKTSRFHQRIANLAALSAAERVDVLTATRAFQQPEAFTTLITTCEAIHHRNDLVGGWQSILTRCAEVQAKSILKEGVQGLAMATALREARIHHLKEVMHE